MNSRIRDMLRNHRGLSLLKRIHAVCWWCYLNTNEPQDKSWIIANSFTSECIEQLYQQAWERSEQGLSEVFGIPASMVLVLIGMSSIRVVNTTSSY